MPKPELEAPEHIDDEQLLDEELLDDENELEEDEELEEDDSDDTDADATPKKKRKRKTFADENVYVYSDVNEAKKAKNNLLYTDGTKVEGARIFKVSTPDDSVTYVVGRDIGFACKTFLDSIDYVVELAFKKRQRGKPATKISASLLAYGQLLAGLIFPDSDFTQSPKEDANPAHVQQWAMFDIGGQYYHYRTPDGKWNEANC